MQEGPYLAWIFTSLVFSPALSLIGSVLAFLSERPIDSKPDGEGQIGVRRNVFDLEFALVVGNGKIRMIEDRADLAGHPFVDVAKRVPMEIFAARFRVPLGRLARKFDLKVCARFYDLTPT